MTPLRVGDRLPAIPLVRADGTPTGLDAYLREPLVVVAIRYYG